MMRPPDHGVILINVLVVLALASTIVFAMLRLSDTAINRSQRFSDASQANALLDGAEATAIAALRRDLRDAPQVDHPAEGWAMIAQQDIAIEGGRFSLTISDAAGKFNLTNLIKGQPEDAQLLQKILQQLDLPEDVGLRIVARLADSPPVTSLDDLLAAGITRAQIDLLSTLVTVLPKPTAINLNTMPDAMFAVLAANPVQARLLQGMRARNGQLSPNDLLNAGLILATQVGVTSAYFVLTTQVTIGDVTQQRETLIARHKGPQGAIAMVIARRLRPE